MAETVHIPKIDNEHTLSPAWVPLSNTDKEILKPGIRCKCGEYCGIGCHHVHADGRVTASFFHSSADWTWKGKPMKGNPRGCGWHVYLILDDYDRGDFPPVDPE